MKKSILKTLFIMLVVFLLAACSQESSQSNEEKTDDNQEKEPAATSAFHIENPKVAFVYNSPIGDGGWAWAHNEGRLYLEKELGVETTYLDSIPEGADAERVFTELAMEGYDVIIGASFGYMDALYKVAQKFPEKVFLHCSGYKTLDNMGTYFGKNFQASYLSGIAAGMMTENNTLGYVAAFPIPELVYNINAFALGAQSVNSEAKVHVVWSNTWYDPGLERQAAMSLLDKGVDGLIAYQDSPASIQAAQEKGAFGFGNDSDMGHFAPETYVTSPIWNWGPYYTEQVKAVMEGTWKSEQYWEGLDSGIVDLSPYGKNVPEEVKMAVEEAKAKIMNGNLEVFTGPLKDQGGTIKLEEGKVLSREEILSSDWFVEGVVGTIPQ